jgi:hypothetical protein
MQYTNKFNSDSYKFNNESGCSTPTSLVMKVPLTSLRVKAEAVQYIVKLRLKVEAVY